MIAYGSYEPAGDGFILHIDDVEPIWVYADYVKNYINDYCTIRATVTDKNTITIDITDNDTGELVNHGRYYESNYYFEHICVE